MEKTQGRMSTIIFRIVVVVILVPSFVVNVALIYGYFELRNVFMDYSQRISQISNPVTPPPMPIGEGLDDEQFRYGCEQGYITEGC